MFEINYFNQSTQLLTSRLISIIKYVHASNTWHCLLLLHVQEKLFCLVAKGISSLHIFFFFLMTAIQKSSVPLYVRTEKDNFQTGLISSCTFQSLREKAQTPEAQSHRFFRIMVVYTSSLQKKNALQKIQVKLGLKSKLNLELKFYCPKYL